jgi:hypothetical protein
MKTYLFTWYYRQRIQGYKGYSCINVDAKSMNDAVIAAKTRILLACPGSTPDKYSHYEISEL